MATATRIDPPPQHPGPARPRGSHEVAELALARLAADSDALARAWLARVVGREGRDSPEQPGSQQVGWLAAERVARDLPPLLAAALGALAEAPTGSEPMHERCRQLARLLVTRGGEGSAFGVLAGDIAALQSVVVGALHGELRDSDPSAFLHAERQLGLAFGAIHAAGAEEIMATRSRELESLANVDALTGLCNRRALEQEMGRLLAMHERYAHPFAVLIFDVDGLKAVNDAFGHAAGDGVLSGVADAVRRTIRSVDTGVRIGGDEFCVLAPNQTAPLADRLARRLAAAVERLEDPSGSPLAISIGIACCPQHGRSGDGLLALADGAMYDARASGLRVGIAPQEPLPRGRPRPAGEELPGLLGLEAHRVDRRTAEDDQRQHVEPHQDDHDEYERAPERGQRRHVG